MNAAVISQNSGIVALARAIRRPLCSNVWISSTTFFGKMVEPAYVNFGYGAGNTHPNRRPQVPM